MKYVNKTDQRTKWDKAREEWRDTKAQGMIFLVVFISAVALWYGG